MKKVLILLLIPICISCKVSDSVIEEYVRIDVYSYENDGAKKMGGMPEFKASHALKKYSRRFEYLLINASSIFQPENRNRIIEIFNLYTNKKEIKRHYLQEFIQDQKLNTYFEATLAPFENPALENKEIYTTKEVMDVASKFFYCDLVTPDTLVQAHVCIGLNGVKEAVWEKDYMLLAAFCYEAIFTDFENQPSKVWEKFVAKKEEAGKKYLSEITSLDQYLLDVRQELFEQMKNDQILKNVLLDYYDANKTNLAFRMIEHTND